MALTVVRNPLAVLFLMSALTLIPFHVAAASAPTASTESQAGDYYEDALMRFEQGEYKETIIQLKNALQLDPKHLPSHILLGKVYLQAGDPVKAAEELVRARGMGADANLIDLDLGRAYLQQGRLDELLKRIVPEQHSADVAAELFLLQGDAYLKRQQYPQAQLAYEQAERLGAAPVKVLLGRIWVQLGQGDRAQALQLAHQAIGAYPDHADAWFVLGRIEQTTGNADQALDAYSRAIQVDPEQIQARLQRAALLIDRAQHRQALADLDEVLKHQPSDPLASYLRSIALARIGRDQEARQALELAANVLDAVPQEALANNPQLLLLAGFAAFDLRRFEEAEALLSKYSTAHPGNLGARKRLAVIQLARNDPDEAMETLEPAYEQAPADPQVLALLGNAHLKKREFSEATSLLEQAAGKLPDNASIRMDLARGYLGADQVEAAVGSLEGLLDSPQQATRAGLLLGALYLKQGQSERAVAAVRTVLQGAADNLAALNLLATAQMAGRDLQAARDSLDKALSLDGGFLPARLNMARLDLLAGDADAARRRYQDLLREYPENKAIMMGLARLEEQQGNPNAAIRWVEKLRSHHPNAIPEILALIDLYLKAEKPERALLVANELAAAHPDNFRAMLALGATELAAGKTELARITFRNLTTAVSYDTRKLYQIAAYQRRAADREDAYWSLTKAVEGDPTYLPAQVALAELEIRLGKFDAAGTRAAEIQQAHPDNVIGYLLEGDLHLARKAYAEAEQAYLRARERQSSALTANRLYAVRLRAGRQNEALATLRDWVEQHPQDLGARKQLAGALIRTGHFPEARKLYEQLAEQMADDPDLTNNLAMLYQMAGDQRALPTARKAYRLAPTNPLVGDTLGWILVENGDPARGLRYLREAQSRRAKLPDISYHIALALQRLGRNDEARRELQTLLADVPEFADRKAAERLLGELGAKKDR